MSMLTGRAVNKGYFYRVENGSVVSTYFFQFNPTEHTRDLDVDYNFVSPPGSPLPTAIFKSVIGGSMSMVLLLDATEGYSTAKEGVAADMAELERYTQPDIDKFLTSLGQFISPPTVVFGRGSDFWNVVIPKMTFRVVRENSYGYPTRVYVDIKMKAIFTSVADIQMRLKRLKRLSDMVTIKEKIEPEWSL